MRAANLFLCANGLMEQAVNVFEIHTTVGHALQCTVKTIRIMNVLAARPTYLQSPTVLTAIYIPTYLHAYSTV